MTVPLRFATFLAPNMVPVYRLLAERIGRRLGRPVELVIGCPMSGWPPAGRHRRSRWPPRCWPAPATAAAPSTTQM
jgi:hypothetical protein